MIGVLLPPFYCQGTEKLRNVPRSYRGREWQHSKYCIYNTTQYCTILYYTDKTEVPSLSDLEDGKFH